jgi:hypothetical protein
MDHKYIRDNQLIDRYLRNELSEGDKEEFEIHFLSDSETLAELEMAERLQQGLQGLDASDELREARSHGWLKGAFLSPQYAAAASILLVFSIGFSGLMYRELQQAPTFTGTQLVPIMATRGTAAGSVIHVGDSADWIVLLVDPGFETYQRFRATVSRQTGAGAEQIWQSENLQPGYEEMLAIGMPGQILEPGAYEIRLEGGRDDATVDPVFVEISRLPFRVE